MRATYIRVKAAEQKISEKNLEYFLYLFKSLQMWPEIVDACDNFEKLTGSVNNDIKNYYLSDTILQMPSSEHYYELVKKAVYDGQEKAGDAAYVTAMTKAHFKDGAIEHALKFFEQEIRKLGDIR